MSVINETEEEKSFNDSDTDSSDSLQQIVEETIEN